MTTCSLLFPIGQQIGFNSARARYDLRGYVEDKQEIQMGQMIDGKWITDALVTTDKSGAFDRKPVTFRNWITADGAPGRSGRGGFKAETGRYHLYVAGACPWAHRTRIFRTLKSLEDHIGLDIAHPDMLEDGWTFSTDFEGTTGDSLFGSRFVREIYAKADPKFTGRVTVPILWDKKTDQIVSNESSEIIRMFNSAFDGITGNNTDYWPTDLRDAIEPVNSRIYETLNNGVYRCGFAKSQGAYTKAASELFDTLDWLEEILSRQRYLIGDKQTEADWRLFPTLYRFDAVYNTHFKCNKRRLVDYENLFAYARELYQTNGISATIQHDQITRHYYYSHESINPYRIVPIGPATDWLAPHGRE